MCSQSAPHLTALGLIEWAIKCLATNPSLDDIMGKGVLALFSTYSHSIYRRGISTRCSTSVCCCVLQEGDSHGTRTLRSLMHFPMRFFVCKNEHVMLIKLRLRLWLRILIALKLSNKKWRWNLELYKHVLQVRVRTYIRRTSDYKGTTTTQDQLMA